MQQINKGNGSGTGDSVKQALLKTADNFVETAQRLDAAERAFPRALRGATPPPAAAFPQAPSVKGSAWTGAVRKGQLLFTALSVIAAGILVLPSGKVVVSAGAAVGGVADVMQLASIAGDGSITALGVPLQVPSSISFVGMEAVGDDLFAVIARSSSGAVIRLIVEASVDGLTVLSIYSMSAVAGADAVNVSSNPRALRTATGIAAIAAQFTSSNVGRLAWNFAVLATGIPGDTTTRTVPISHAYRAAAGGEPIAADRVGTDVGLVCANAMISGSADSQAVLQLVSATDDFVAVIDSIKVDALPASNIAAVVALSGTRAIARPSATAGAMGVEVVDGELQRLSVTLQTQGVLARAWVASVPQDAERALVFEQAGNTAAPTVIRIDPATGDITEEGTVPLLFGTSGYPRDAFKIGPNRVLVAGRAGASTTQAALEVWDLS